MEQAIDVAKGYLHLGLVEDAWEELDLLPPEIRSTKPVLEMRIGIYQALEKWREAGELAGALIKHFPEDLNLWVKWAECLFQEGLTDTAEAVLVTAQKHHPDDAKILYALARYATRNCRMDEARELLKRAFNLDPRLRKTALDDPDLDPTIFG